MKRTAGLFGMLALVLLVAVTATAQETRGSLEGIVRDNTGAVLPGVSVEARSPALVGVSTATTDAAGVYRFPALAPGVYEVTAILAGFQTSKNENIQLQLGQILRINFAMQVSGVTESVQVTAESPIIDVKQNAATLNIQSELIDRIPKGRDFTSVLTSAPGTNQEAKAGGFQIDGASGSENRFVIDGLDTTSLRTGVSNKELLTDFVEQVQVKSSGYNAEFRATTGGVITAVTKSGANRWRGSFGTYYSNDDWLGDVRPSIRLAPSTNQTTAEYIVTPRPQTSYDYDLVGDLGGPILRDRAWFYFGFAPQIARRELTTTFCTGSGASRTCGPNRTFPSYGEDYNYNYNISSQLRSNMRLRFTGSNERSNGRQSLPGLEPDATTNANAALFPNPVTSNSLNDSYVGDLSWVVSPKFFVNANVGLLMSDTWQVTETQFYEGIRRTFNNSNTCNPNATPGSSGCPFPQIPTSLQQLAGFADNQANTHNRSDKYGRLGFNLDGTYYGTFKGQHTLKAGVQYERIGNEVDTGQQNANIEFIWNASRQTLDNPPRLVRGTYGYYRVFRQYTTGDIHSNNVGIFVQDAWTVNSRLTLNLGIRADSEDIPSYIPENPGISFGFMDKLAPRVGFAYDIKGDGKWKGYGSFGMFYDIQKLEMPRGLWGGDKWVNYYFTLESFDWPSINCPYPPVVGSPGCPGTFIEQVDSRHVANDPNNFLVDPNLKPVRSKEFTVGLDHELTRTMSVGIRYAHKLMDRTIEDVGVQQAGVGEIFRISNPGEGIAENVLRDFAGCTNCPNQPKPRREYDGIELRLRKRLADRWSLNTSYLWSRLNGNYSGLASSDENGRTSPNVNRFFDGQYMSFDQTGRPVFGALQTDRPHQFKVQTTYDLPWGTGIGVNYFVESGTPQQSTITVRSVPVFDQGRGSLGRTSALSQTDILVYQDFSLRGAMRVNLGVQVINLFDQDTVTRVAQARYRDGIPVSDAQFFGAFDAQAIAAVTPAIRPDARFNRADQFLGARSVRVQAKFLF